FFFQAEDGIRDRTVTGVQTCALPILSSLSGMGNLSGTVTSSRPFKAAQVYMRNVDKRIMYTVYTNAGQFRSVALFPGNYEVSVKIGRASCRERGWIAVVAGA